MSVLSKIESFEQSSALVYLNAFRLVTDGWSLCVTIIATAPGSGATVYEVPETREIRFASSGAALEAGRRLADAHLAGN
jgi:hypothetical protein